MSAIGASVLAQSKTFYDREYAAAEYANADTHGDAGGLPELNEFVQRFHLSRDRKCLEIGCGRGIYQDLVEDYTGVDLSESVGRLMRKPFHACSATELPFEESTFDAAWSIWVLEHVPEPEKALLEMRRVLRPGAVLFFAPAWQCRPWAADGYPVRPYSDFDLKGKLIKASIPVRNSIAFRSSYIFPRRVARLGAWKATGRPLNFRCGTLKPNYEKFWVSDSDAVNSMDPYEAILWFRSRGDEILHPSTPMSQFLVRNGHLIVRINK